MLIYNQFRTQMKTNNSSINKVYVGSNISVGAKVSVGGDLHNLSSGKIKVFPSGELVVNSNLINEGDIIINDPEKFKEILLESIKTAKNVTELGSLILKAFFK
ncbi:MAG: hypothetical protein QXO70_00310 [Candidatus Pacearchaeota archaeon]